VTHSKGTVACDFGSGEGVGSTMMDETISKRGVWTIGHSSRSLEDFLALLKGAIIEQVADVRRYPGSRAFPHFNQGLLAHYLKDNGIQYLHFPELGGRRNPNPESPHTVWKNSAFQAYADYMDQEAFRSGLIRLVQVANEMRTAIVCAEALWWRCHRSMIADALKARGIKVLHIMGAGKFSEHPYTSAAKIIDGKLYYGDGRDSRWPEPV
jgi:uncharacterized protein (DUF488 family)